MYYLVRFLWILLFLFVLTFTVKNTEIVVLRYYFNNEWQAPLILILLLFFTIGFVIGISCCMGKIFNQRREIIMLRKKCSVLEGKK